MRKSILIPIIILASTFLIIVAAKPAVYIGGLLILEITNPRAIFFKGSPDRIWKNGFETTVNLECNHIYERNIRMHFEPELLISEEPGIIQGTVFLD